MTTNITVTSDDDYVIVVDSTDGASTRFFRVDDGYGNIFITVDENGATFLDGKVNIDDHTFSVRTTSGSATWIANFLNKDGDSKLGVQRADGTTRAEFGQLLLRFATAALGSPINGDAFWYDNAGTWTLRVRWAGAWSELSTTSC